MSTWSGVDPPTGIYRNGLSLCWIRQSIIWGHTQVPCSPVWHHCSTAVLRILFPEGNTNLLLSRLIARWHLNIHSHKISASKQWCMPPPESHMQGMWRILGCHQHNSGTGNHTSVWLHQGLSQLTGLRLSPSPTYSAFIYSQTKSQWLKWKQYIFKQYYKL